MGPVDRTGTSLAEQPAYRRIAVNPADSWRDRADTKEMKRGTIPLALGCLALAAAATVLGLTGLPGSAPAMPGPAGKQPSGADATELSPVAGNVRATGERSGSDAPSGHRVATASEGTRPVSLRCRCATIDEARLGAVWDFLGLVLSIEDSEGTTLAKRQRPHEPLEVAIPLSVPELVLRAPGYVPKTLRLPDRPRDRLDLGTVTLEPDALVRVEVRSVPARAEPWLRVTARFQEKWVGGQPWLWPGAERVVGSGDGRAELALAIPSGLRTRVRLATVSAVAPLGAPDRWSDPFVLATGEERSVVFDLGHGLTLNGQLTGLADAARSGQSVVAQKASGWAVHRAVCRTDARGRFAFVDLPAEDYQLLVADIPLREEGTQLTTWNPEHRGELRVEPAVPTAALQFVERGEPVLAAVAVAFGGPPRPEHAGMALPLFAVDTLRQQAQLYAWVEGFGHLTHALGGAAPGPGGLLPIEVPARTGSILVRAAGAPENLTVLARPAAASLDPARWRNGIRAASVAGGWLLDDLEPGPYELRWSSAGKPDLRRAFAGPVQVRAGERTELDVAAPRRGVLPGEVINWDDLPSELRPGLAFAAGPRLLQAARITADGRFELQVLGIPDSIETVTLGGAGFGPEISTGDFVYDRHEPALRVRFPLERAGGWLLVEPVDGGEIRAEFASPTAQRFLPNMPWFHGRVSRADADGRIRLLDGGGPTDVVLCETVGRTTHLLRWLRVPNPRRDREVPRNGRWVAVDAGAALPQLGHPVLLFDLGAPAWWPHGRTKPLMLQLDAAGRGRFWLPAGATGVRLRRDAAEIPAARIGDRLELDADLRPMR